MSRYREILENSYVGIIEKIDDPNFEGRCKIRVFGVFEDFDQNVGSIPTDDLPWAYPLEDMRFGKAGSGSFSTPRLDSKVKVFFDGDIYTPRYYSNEELSEKLKSLIEDDYENFSSFVVDEDEKLNVYYAKKTGYIIDLDEKIINVKPDNSIVVQLKGTTAVIELKDSDIDIIANSLINLSAKNTVTASANKVWANGVETDIGGKPIFSAVNGEPLFALLQILATGLDAKFPTTPGKFVEVVNSMKSVVLSTTVKTSP